jgi:hypothetical protein
MRTQDAIRPIEAAWQMPNGVLFRLRRGILDQKGLSDLVNLLKTIERPGENESLPRRFVSLLWYVPIFMHWQEERVRESGGSIKVLEDFATLATNEIERILGVP